MGYCFVCDAPVDGTACPSCGTTAWTDDTTTDHLSRSSPTDQPDPPQPQPRPRPPAPRPVDPNTSADGSVLHMDEVPHAVDHSPVQRPTVLPRWPLVAAVVLVLVLVAIRIPTGREDVEDAAPGELPVPATPLPEPRQYDLQWVPGDQTTVAILGQGAAPVMAIRRFGPLDPIYAASVASRSGEADMAAVDITPDGSVVTWDGNAVSVWSPTLGTAAQLATGVRGAPALSPNGRLLAVPVDTAVFVYDMSDRASGASRPGVATSAVSDVSIDSVHWSPDGAFVGGGSRDEWIVFDAVSGVTTARGSGELLAVGGGSAVAIRVEDDVEYHVAEGVIQRRWSDIVTDGPERLTRAEFSPDLRHLAIQSTRADAPAVLVLDLEGRDVFRVGTRPGIGTDRSLAWSGTGLALYWLDGTQLVAWRTDTRQTVLVTERDDPADFPSRIHGIRVYDQALVPTGQLVERPAAPPTVMADGVVMTQFEGAVVIDRDLLSGPVGATIESGASVTEGGRTRWGASFDDGRSIFQPGEASTGNDELVTVDGGSITSLGTQFMWLSGGDVYSEASMPDPLLRSTVFGNGEIVGLVGLRDSLVIAFRDVGRITQLWQVPAWSSALREPLVANRGDALPASPFTITGTFVDADIHAMTRSIQHDAFALTLAFEAEGPQSIVFFYPETNVSSVCGVQLGACQGPNAPGRALTFSPAGHWVLLERAGPNVALSTRGRGELTLSDEAAVWTP